ncbi:hypothetical protein PPYR_02015 [Photinus pyralis]|uniref:Uncharacterized protein n=2 Tax=Photinus pyralis TaxID=7054 RepID=A0A5N4B617_PHOPY|nr:uncharacterized protein LOC116159430 [Photinus pyralis]XP_031337434.1 uncharacterized protein LOC116166569 [Photinus pyralis]KAB0805045.1 hypothetical protein PPYR_02015 [Photinus pyralis]
MLLTVLCLTLLAATATSAEISQDIITNIRNTIKDIKGPCLQSEGASETDLEDILSKGIYSTSRNLKCALKCLYIGTNIISSTGVINEANMKLKTGTINVNTQNAVFANCAGFTNADLCERVYEISKCTYRTLKGSFGATWLDT